MDVVEKNKIILKAQIYRLNNGISARKFAGILKVHHSNYSRIEKGSEACSDIMLEKITARLNYLNVSLANKEIECELEEIIKNQCNFDFRESDQRVLNNYKINGEKTLYSYLYEIAEFKAEIEMNFNKKPKIKLSNLTKIIDNLYRCDRKYYFIAKIVLGSYFTKSEKYDEAHDCFIEVIDFCKDNDCLSLAYFYLGIISAMRENKPFQALEFNIKARDLFVNTQNYLGLLRVELSIGNNYSSLGEYDKAIDIFIRNYASRNSLSESISFFEKSQLNIILCYIRKGEYSKAVPYIEKSYLMDKENDLLYIYAIWIFYRLNNDEECMRWIEKYELLKVRHELYVKFIDILLKCISMNNDQENVVYLLKLLEIKEKQPNLIINEFIYILLIDTYIHHGRYQEAYETLLIKNKYFTNSSRY